MRLPTKLPAFVGAGIVAVLLVSLAWPRGVPRAVRVWGAVELTFNDTLRADLEAALRCAGVRPRLPDGLRIWVVPDSADLRDAHGMRLAGVFTPLTRDIVVQDGPARARTLRHEAMHAVLPLDPYHRNPAWARGRACGFPSF